MHVVILGVIGLTINGFWKGHPLTGGRGTYPFVSYPMFATKRGSKQKIVAVTLTFRTASGDTLDAGPQWWERYGMQSHRYKRYLGAIKNKGKPGLRSLVERMNRVRTDDPVIYAAAEVQDYRMADRTHEALGEARRVEVTIAGRAE